MIRRLPEAFAQFAQLVAKDRAGSPNTMSFRKETAKASLFDDL
jgi:hypothetical protein